MNNSYIIPADVLSASAVDVSADFCKWREMMYSRVDFNMADSLIHARPHCERVLLHALTIGKQMLPDDSRALTALAHAAVFHDTRRLDDYLDTGHGARAALYYKQFCEANPDVECLPEAVYAMRYHDLADGIGIEAIKRDFGADADRAADIFRIFKDADALDRWRLGHNGLDPRYLRTDAARSMTDFARKLVARTMDPDILGAIEKEVDEAIERQKSQKGSR